MVVQPDCGASQRNQTGLPPALPAISGSPGSLVAAPLKPDHQITVGRQVSPTPTMVGLPNSEPGKGAVVVYWLQSTTTRHISKPRLMASTATLMSAKEAPPV